MYIFCPELLPPGQTSYKESVKKVLDPKCPKFLGNFGPKAHTNFLIRNKYLKNFEGSNGTILNFGDSKLRKFLIKNNECVFGPISPPIHS